MAEPKNQVTPEQAIANREADFARAQARREEVARRVQEMGGQPDMSHEFKWEANPGTIWELPSDEPTFTFRAQDILSVMVLDHYARLLEMYEPTGPKSAQVIDELNKFRAWQQANPGKVKLPD